MLPCCSKPRRVRRWAAPAILRPFIMTSARTGLAKQLLSQGAAVSPVRRWFKRGCTYELCALIVASKHIAQCAMNFFIDRYR